jgi:replicative DNA helicase
MGKTALALNITQNVAFRFNGVTAFFSLEMSASQLEERIICSEGRINSHSYRTGRLEENEWQRVDEIRENTQNSRLFIDDTPSVDIPYMRSKLRRLVRDERQLDLVVIDYLQLMRGKGDNRENVVSQISRDLKTLSKEFRVPIIATAQLNRKAEDRRDHIPNLGDLRDSGGIEQDADAVVFIYRPDYYNTDISSHTGLANLIIAKQRNGPTGEIQLEFNSPTSSFRNIEPSAF